MIPSRTGEEPPKLSACTHARLSLDGANRIAADRYVFAAAISADPGATRDGVMIATRYLAWFPEDGTLRMDRALCYQHEGALAEAIDDFQRSARLERDPRAFMFAALDERALHHAARARTLLKSAIGLDPHFEAARAALARS